MSWHYMPVWREDKNGDLYWVLCEVDCDNGGRLRSWQEDPKNLPSGSSVQELRDTLAIMLLDACRYSPVAYDEMAIGDVLDAQREERPGHETAIETLRAVIKAFGSEKRGAEPEVT